MCTSCISCYCLQGQAACGPQNHNPAVKSVMFLGFLVPTYNTEHYCHLHLLSVSNNFMYLWRLILNIIKTYITSFFHRKSNITHTHTHTHIFQVAKCGRKLSASLTFGHCLYITQNNTFWEKKKCFYSHWYGSAYLGITEFFSVQEVQ